MSVVSDELWDLSNKTLGMHSPLNLLLMTEEPADRRKKPRLSLPLPVTVRWGDSNGRSFVIDTVLDNISASGAYIRMPNRLELGTTVRVLVRFSISSETSQGARVASHGDVIRVEEDGNGMCGVAIRFTNHRFL